MPATDQQNTSGTKRKRPDDASDNEEFGDLHDEDEEGGIRVGNIYIPPPPKAICSNDIGAARLIIEKIVNRDFKSYAGIQEVGPFHKCFSSIMGPNGSGKSNVIDSMLFVFGYRATKIRSSKVAHLLHNAGGKVHSCCVAVYFKEIIDIDDEKFEDVPNSSFVISRTGFADNSSYYQLNNKKVHFKQIEKLLKQHGIDLDHNRFLILQGEVEQISMMKPKGVAENETGMLEYLEDIIGTTRFKEPLNQLAVHLETLTEERIEKIQQVKIVEKERHDMKVPYEEAIEYLKTENDVTQLRNIKCQKYIYDTDLMIKEKKEKRKELVANLDEIKANIEETVKTRKEKEEALTSEMTKKKAILAAKAQNKEKYALINKEDAQLQAEMIDVNKRRKANQKSIKEAEQKLTELENIPNKNKEKIEEMAQKLIETNEQKDALEQQKTEALEIVARETKPLQTKRQALETDLVSLNQVVQSARAEFKIAESELEVYMKTEKDEESALQKINEAYEQCKASFDEQQPIIENLKNTIPKTEAELRKAEVDLSAAQEAESVITRKMNAIRNKLEEGRASMQRDHFSNRVVSAIMKQKSDGHLPGVLGRLGDLGGIDLKYDVAISTACGALDHIVVDNIQTAKDCIKYLQDNNLGRQSFLALDKQDHLLNKANAPIQTPENALRLFDLVRYTDQRLKTAFYFALRDTLVADNLTQATRIAYGERRFRVVTLQGEIIELAGTMSGGGKFQAKGRMGQRVTVNTNLNVSVEQERFREMEEQLEQLRDQLNQVRNDQVRLQQSIFELTNKLRDYKFQHSKASMEYESLLKQLPILKRQQKKQEEKVANSKCDPEDIKQFETIIQTKKQALEKATAAADKIKVQVDKVTDEIKSKSQTGGGFKQIQTKLNEKKKLIEKLKQESTKLEVEIKTSIRNVAKTEERLRNLEVDVKNAEDTITKLKDRRDKYEIDGTKVLELIEKLENELLEFGENDGAEDRKEIAKLVEKENKLKAENIDVEHTLSSLDTAIKDLVHQLDVWKRKLSQLSLHKIPNNEIEEELRYEDDGTGEPTPSTSKESRKRTSVEIDKLPILTEQELKDTQLDDVHYSITVKQDLLKQKNPNLNIIPEFRRVQSKYCNRVQEVEEISAKRQEARNIIDKVKRTRENEFSTGYQIINLKLKEMYQMITLGGDAELELVDSLDPFHEGVSFIVRPPKKTWKNISNLSGGEKTLSSLALVFALHYYKPSPLYVMDEIDAALDFKNVSIVGNYIKDRTKNAQFIIISLRSNMFELADRLVGIYKTENRTKCVPCNPKLLAQYLPQVVNQENLTQQSKLTMGFSQQTQIGQTLHYDTTQLHSSILPSQLGNPVSQPTTSTDHNMDENSTEVQIQPESVLEVPGLTNGNQNSLPNGISES